MTPRMRFLHTSDWQLGLSRYYLDDDARARYAAGRFDAIRRLGELAAAEGAEFVVVAGDVFDSNRVAPRTLLRGLDAMAAVPVPLLLLPGNHDCLDAASIYNSRTFRDQKPANVKVLDGDSAVGFGSEVEVVGAPWRTKRPLVDLVAERAAALEPAAGRLRVMVGHGAVDSLSPDADDPARIRLDDAQRALDAGLYHFLALGDRHSATRVADRIWYSGTPEATDFNEERPGRVLRVDLTAAGCQVEELEVGRWQFLRQTAHLGGEADLGSLRAELDGVADPSRTVLRLRLAGQLPLHARADLDRLLAAAGERFAAVDRVGHEELALIPDELDHDALSLGGWAAAAFEELRTEAEEKTGKEARVAADALALLYRLAGDTGAGEPTDGAAGRGGSGRDEGNGADGSTEGAA